MKEKPYIITITSGDFIVGLPNQDNEVEIEWDGDRERIYLSKDDVEKILERFD